MKKQNIASALEAGKQAQQMVDKRLWTSKIIVSNLYRKHLHNFVEPYGTPYSLKSIFPWLQYPAVIKGDKVFAGDQEIPEVYLSGDVWRIAKAVRQDAYVAHGRRHTEDVRRYQDMIEELVREKQLIEHNIKQNEGRAQRAQAKVDALANYRERKDLLDAKRRLAAREKAAVAVL